MSQKEVSLKKKNIFAKIVQMVGVLYKGILTLWKRHHFIIPLNMWKHYFKRLTFKLKFRGNSPYLDPNDPQEYREWLKNNSLIVESINLNIQPKISFIVPVYNTNPQELIECIDSVLNQSYKNVEVCIADDHSNNEKTIETLSQLVNKDQRIKLVSRKTNGHISCASNDALALAEGEYIALLDHDDVLDINAALIVVQFINQHPQAEFIYSDEDKLDPDGLRCSPHFKPDYSPDTLLSSNYICHLAVIKRSLIFKVGGFREGYEGSQDHDLFLRLSLETNHIYHIPKILYHWRMSKGSTASSSGNKNYAQVNGIKAIKSFLAQKKLKAEVTIDSKSGYYLVNYELDQEPLISILIPTKDNVPMLSQCLKSVFELNDYKNFEVIVVDNRSTEKETQDLFDQYRETYPNFRVVKADIDFNYSTINNLAAKEANGAYLLLLNNDTQVITKNWLRQMVGVAMQSHVGAVGALLLYKDRTIQHGGVVLGIGGVATHAFQYVHESEIGLYGRLCVPYDYSAVTAACLMISKEKFDEIQGFDENLKVAYNDVDLCLKLLKAGYYNVMLPQVKLFHFESRSRGADFTSKKYDRYLMESEYMYTQWNTLIENDPFYNPNFTQSNCFLLDRKS